MNGLGHTYIYEDDKLKKKLFFFLVFKNSSCRRRGLLNSFGYVKLLCCFVVFFCVLSGFWIDHFVCGVVFLLLLLLLLFKIIRVS